MMTSILATLRRWLGFPIRPAIGVPLANDTPSHPSRVPEGMVFRAPWHASTGTLHYELYGECGPGHKLYGVVARQVATRGDCDDVLFELFGENAPAQFAVVHLTWGSRPDRNLPFPSTGLYASFEEWVRECMIPEAEEWAEWNEE
jgi:hypothetical protein